MKIIQCLLVFCLLILSASYSEHYLETNFAYEGEAYMKGYGHLLGEHFLKGLFYLFLNHFVLTALFFYMVFLLTKNKAHNEIFAIGIVFWTIVFALLILYSGLKFYEFTQLGLENFDRWIEIFCTWSFRIIAFIVSYFLAMRFGW